MKRTESEKLLVPTSMTDPIYWKGFSSCWAFWSGPRVRSVEYEHGLCFGLKCERLFPVRVRSRRTEDNRLRGRLPSEWGVRLEPGWTTAIPASPELETIRTLPHIPYSAFFFPRFRKPLLGPDETCRSSSVVGHLGNHMQAGNLFSLESFA